MTSIDISEFQSNVNYELVKQNIDMVILRAGFTGYGISKSKQKDKLFETHYNGFNNIGVPIGVYWYSCAYSEEEAIIEARKVLEIVKDKNILLPIFIDVEDNHNINLSGCSNINQVTIGKDKLTNVVKAFCEEIEKNGYYVGIYASAYWLGSRLDMSKLSMYDVWVAHWGVDEPSYNGNYGVWQYTSNGSINGINGRVDLNYVYKDYPSIIRNKNLNKLNNIVEVPIEDTKNDIVYIVNKGDTLSKIAGIYNTTYQILASYNNIENPNLIHIGDKILIPSNNTTNNVYTVKNGDTLSSIAAIHNTTWQVIYEKNKEIIGSNPNLIYPGQNLIIN